MNCFGKRYKIHGSKSLAGISSLSAITYKKDTLKFTSPLSIRDIWLKSVSEHKNASSDCVKPLASRIFRIFSPIALSLSSFRGFLTICFFTHQRETRILNFHWDARPTFDKGSLSLRPAQMPLKNQPWNILSITSCY